MTKALPDFRVAAHAARPNHTDLHCNHNLERGDDSERGGARLNFLIVMFIIAIVGYGVANYAPVAYNAVEYKSVMQSKVDQAVALGHTGEWVSQQLRASAGQYDVPPDAVITAVVKDNRIEAVVSYTRPIPLPGFIYNYEFDHSVRSSNVLNTSSASNF